VDGTKKGRERVDSEFHPVGFGGKIFSKREPHSPSVGHGEKRKSWGEEIEGKDDEVDQGENPYR